MPISGLLLYDKSYNTWPCQEGETRKARMHTLLLLLLLLLLLFIGSRAFSVNCGSDLIEGPSSWNGMTFLVTFGNYTALKNNHFMIENCAITIKTNAADTCTSTNFHVFSFFQITMYSPTQYCGAQYSKDSKVIFTPGSNILYIVISRDLAHAETSVTTLNMWSVLILGALCTYKYDLLTKLSNPLFPINKSWRNENYVENFLGFF